MSGQRRNGPDSGPPEAREQQAHLFQAPNLRSEGPERAGVVAEGPTTYQVGQLVRLVSRKLEQRFAAVWVEGEISNLRRPGSGHLYLTLKDDRAQLPVVMFRSQAARLSFAPRDGLRVRMLGRLSIYESQGRFQLTAERAELAGEGALQAAFEELKRKLRAAGLFEARHKKPLPTLPRWAVLITSPSGAAVRDILRVLEHRLPLRISIWPTSVQGPEATLDIAHGVRQADRLGADVLVVTRGGGSLEDLAPFNSEPVARAIHQAQTPVVSAVGHEIDLTIADLVADARAPTPSAAAELLAPLTAEITTTLAMRRQQLVRAMSHELSRKQLVLERLRRQLGTPAGLLEPNRQRLDELVQAAESTLLRRLGRTRVMMSSLVLRLETQRPSARLARDQAVIDELRRRMATAMGQQLVRLDAELAQLAATLNALSPLAVLSRGYSLVHDEGGRLVRDARDVSDSDPLRIRLARGELHCRIERRVVE